MGTRGGAMSGAPHKALEDPKKVFVGFLDGGIWDLFVSEILFAF